MKPRITPLLLLISLALSSCTNEPVTTVTQVGEHAEARGKEGAVHVGVAAKNPAFSEAARLVGEHRTDEAIVIYKKLCKTETGQQQAIAYWGLGAAYTIDKQDEKAVENYLKSLEIDSANSGPYIGLGTSYGNLGNNEKGIACYKKALSMDERSTEAYWGLAIAYDETGDRQLARENARKYLQLEPNSNYAALMKEIINK